MKMTLTAAVLLTLLIGHSCFANDDVTQVSRYSTVSNKPMLYQKKPLEQIINVRFTPNEKKIRDAINHLLQISGYCLESESEQEPGVKIILSKPIPLIDRELNSMSVKDALKTLVGEAFYFQDDPIHRIIKFHVKPEYKKLLAKEV